MLVINFGENENMIGTFFIESPMDQVAGVNSEYFNDTASKMEEKKMKVRKTRRGKPRRWCMDDLLDQRPVLAVSPQHQRVSPCTSPQAEDTCITPRYRYDTQVSPVSKIHGRKQNLKFLRPYNDPGAPHNTTEFLIQDKMDYPFNYDDHLRRTYESNHFRLAISSAYSSSSFEEGFKAYASDGENCLTSTSTSDDTSSDSSLSSLCSSQSYDKAQFEEAYENAKAVEIVERNSSLSHSELVSSIKALSRRISRLEKEERREKSQSHTSTKASHSSISVSSLQDELSSLMAENRQLREENENLKSRAESS